MVQITSMVVFSWNCAAFAPAALAVLEDRPEHRAEHDDEDRHADPEDPPVQVVDVLRRSAVTGVEDVHVVVGERRRWIEAAAARMRGGAQVFQKAWPDLLLYEFCLIRGDWRSCRADSCASSRRPSSDISLPSGTVRPAYARPSVQRSPRSRTTTRAHGRWATKRVTERASRESTLTSSSPISSRSKSRVVRGEHAKRERPPARPPGPRTASPATRPAPPRRPPRQHRGRRDRREEPRAVPRCPSDRLGTEWWTNGGESARGFIAWSRNSKPPLF